MDKKPSKQTLYDLYVNQGLSAVKIANLYGVSDNTVGKWLRKAAIPVRSIIEAQQMNIHGKILEMPTKEELIQLYWVEKLPTHIIGERYGVTGATVRNWMKKHIIRRRNTSEFRKGAKCPWSVETGRRLCLERNKNNNPSKRPEVKALRSKQQQEIMLKLWQNEPERYAGMIEGVRNAWKNPEEKRRRLKKIHTGKNKATKAEIKVKDVLDEHFNFIHSSVKGVVIGDKIPDFIDEKNKIIVEVFGRWYHDKKLNPTVDEKRTPVYTIRHYVGMGYKIIIVWHDEIRKLGWQERLVEEIKKILKGELQWKCGLFA